MDVTTTPEQARFDEALKKFIAASDELAAAWNSAIAVRGYPEYLPSFDEFTADLYNLKRDDHAAAFFSHFDRMTEAYKPHCAAIADALRDRGVTFEDVSVAHTGGGIYLLCVTYADGRYDYIGSMGALPDDPSEIPEDEQWGITRHDAEGNWIEDAEGNIESFGNDPIDLGRAVALELDGQFIPASEVAGTDRYPLTDPQFATILNEIRALRDRSVGGAMMTEEFTIRPATADDQFSLITVGEIVHYVEAIAIDEFHNEHRLSIAIGESGKVWDRKGRV